jgi:hypothetical protein
LPDRHRTVRTAVTARDQPPLIIEQERLEIPAAMNIDSGTAIVLVYVLVSMGVIIASLLARAGDRMVHRSPAGAPQQANGAWRQERREGSDRSGAAKLHESLWCADHLQNAAPPRADPCLAGLPRYVALIGHS